MSSTESAVAEGASSRSMDVNSSSVNSSRQASRSGGWVSMAARSRVERHVAVDGDEFFREQDGVAILLEGFAIGFALDLGGAVEDGFDGAEFEDQLDAALVADAGGAGNVVDRSRRAGP